MFKFDSLKIKYKKSCLTLHRIIEGLAPTPRLTPFSVCFDAKPPTAAMPSRCLPQLFPPATAAILSLF